MTVIEILKDYRNGDVEFMLEHGKYDSDTMRKIQLLETIFEESKFTQYRLESIKVVRMYYKEISSISVIAKIIHVSERNVYRMRDKCVEWLSAFLDNYPSPMNKL